MQHGIRTPGPPCFGRIEQRSPTPTDGSTQHEVAFEKRVRVTKRSHRDVLGRPAPDSRNAQQSIACLHGFARATEVECARTNGGRKRTDRRRTLPREPVLLEGGVGQRVGGWKGPPFAAVDYGGASERGHESRAQRAGAGH